MNEEQLRQVMQVTLSRLWRHVDTAVSLDLDMIREEINNQIDRVESGEVVHPTTKTAYRTERKPLMRRREVGCEEC